MPPRVIDFVKSFLDRGEILSKKHDEEENENTNCLKKILLETFGFSRIKEYLSCKNP